MRLLSTKTIQYVDNGGIKQHNDATKEYKAHQYAALLTISYQIG